MCHFGILLVCSNVPHTSQIVMPSTGDAWASSGYDSCPVQKVGANGEMSTLGSKRVSRRWVSPVQQAAHRCSCSGVLSVVT